MSACKDLQSLVVAPHSVHFPFFITPHSLPFMLWFSFVGCWFLVFGFRFLVLLADLDGLEACFGEKLVLTLAEFEAQGHKPLHINLTFWHRHLYDVTIPPSHTCNATSRL